MNEHELQAVRDDLFAFLAYERHGAINKLAEELGISRQHLTSFRDGGSISDDLAERIADMVQRRNVQDDPLSIIAGELENVLRILRSPSFDDAFKVERLFNRVAEIQASKESIKAALAKKKKGGK
jgi:hypothetical protein